MRRGWERRGEERAFRASGIWYSNCILRVCCIMYGMSSGRYETAVETIYGASTMVCAMLGHLSYVRGLKTGNDLVCSSTARVFGDSIIIPASWLLYVSP
jgi:hypothetical protein